MLQMMRLPMPARTGTKNISIVELFGWVVRLASPMFNLHNGRLTPDPPHAVAAQAPLLCDERMLEVRPSQRNLS